MKLKSLVMALALTLSASAFAWFPANPRMYVLPLEARAEVTNFTGWPIRCQGYVFGRTFYGFVRQAWFDQVIFPGQFRIAVVGAFPADPFVQGWAQINCM